MTICKTYIGAYIHIKNQHIKHNGLNTFLVLIFVVFVADDPHFHRMFKMVLIFTECLEWSSLVLLQSSSSCNPII